MFDRRRFGALICTKIGYVRLGGHSGLIKPMALYSPSCEVRPEMIYLKGVLIGFGSVLLGTPIALMIWTIWKSQRGAATVSFSPMGLANHLEHSLGFWVFIIVLFTAGFVPSTFLKKR